MSKPNGTFLVYQHFQIFTTGIFFKIRIWPHFHHRNVDQNSEIWGIILPKEIQRMSYEAIVPGTFFSSFSRALKIPEVFKFPLQIPKQSCITKDHNKI